MENKELLFVGIGIFVWFSIAMKLTGNVQDIFAIFGFPAAIWIPIKIARKK